MTCEELSNLLNIKTYTLENQFNRTKRNLLKKAILIEKNKKRDVFGKIYWDYGILFPNERDFIYEI